MKTIRVSENSLFPLSDLAVGRASAINITVIGVDRSYTNVQIAFGQVASGGNPLAAPCKPCPGGEWRCYATGAFFLAKGESSYHITAKTAEGNSIYLGGGRLIVTPSVLNVEDIELPVLPDECYVRGSNGLYYRVTVELDPDGVPYMVVDPEGITK